MLAALAAARFAHFATTCLLFGLAAFPFYAGEAEASPRRRERIMLALGLLTLLTGVLELLAMAASMGDSWGAALDRDTLIAAITDTRFGQVWVWRLGSAAAIPLLFVRQFPGRDSVLLIAATLLLGSIALTGHSVMPGGLEGIAHQTADAVHLLAAGWWLGGLLALLLVARTAGTTLPELLGRFSRLGVATVALLTLSGLAKSVILVTSPVALATTGYGRLLLAKLVLFGAMGLLALSNRQQVTPALARDHTSAFQRGRLARQVTAELACGLLVLVVVGLLGAIAPPIAE